jgi:hypothetical protein
VEPEGTGTAARRRSPDKSKTTSVTQAVQAFPGQGRGKKLVSRFAITRDTNPSGNARQYKSARQESEVNIN